MGNTENSIVQRFHILIFLFLILSCQSSVAETLNIVTSSQTLVFTVEIANTPALRKQGLMHRKRLSIDAAMLFEFEYAKKVSMWMKNTRIPLDILFIQKDGTIVHFYENAVPESTEIMTSPVAVYAVLEINAGLVRKYGIKNGDQIEHEIFSVTK